MVLNTFLPLQGAISQAESWTRYLSAQRPELASRQPEEIGHSLESIVWLGVSLGELLPLTWRVTFEDLFRPGEPMWSTVQEFESIRQEVRRLFFTARQALDMTRHVAETMQSPAGPKPTGMERLLAAIENARRLEEVVFRDWPSFAEQLPLEKPADFLDVDESLADALGISVEEARQRLDARRRQLTERG